MHTWFDMSIYILYFICLYMVMHTWFYMSIYGYVYYVYIYGYTWYSYWRIFLYAAIEYIFNSGYSTLYRSTEHAQQRGCKVKINSVFTHREATALSRSSEVERWAYKMRASRVWILPQTFIFIVYFCFQLSISNNFIPLIEYGETFHTFSLAFCSWKYLVHREISHHIPLWPME